MKNIRDTIRVLLETNPKRRVVLCDIMSGNGFRLDKDFAHVYDCVNKQIIDLTKAKNPLATGPFDFGDRFPKWVHMSPPKVVGKRDVKCSDGVHLNSKGYKGISDWSVGELHDRGRHGPRPITQPPPSHHHHPTITPSPTHPITTLRPNTPPPQHATTPTPQRLPPPRHYVPRIADDIQQAMLQVEFTYLKGMIG